MNITLLIRFFLNIARWDFDYFGSNKYVYYILSINNNNNNNKFISYGANSMSKAPRPTYSSSGTSSTVSQKRPQTEHCYCQLKKDILDLES